MFNFAHRNKVEKIFPLELIGVAMENSATPPVNQITLLPMDVLTVSDSFLSLGDDRHALRSDEAEKNLFAVRHIENRLSKKNWRY